MSVRTLADIAAKYPTDKIDHGFVGVYEEALGGRRGSVSSLLEIGVHEGNSLMMWADYFPGAHVVGVDLRSYRLGAFGPRVSTYVADQGSTASLQNLVAMLGGPQTLAFDVVIDDGSHRMLDQQMTLGVLWPLLSPGGIYIVEDLHTSLPGCPFEWSGGGCRDDFSNSSLEALKRLSAGEPLGSVYLDRATNDMIASECESCKVYDTRGDGRHITSVLRKKGVQKTPAPSHYAIGV